MISAMKSGRVSQDGRKSVFRASVVASKCGFSKFVVDLRDLGRKGDQLLP